MSLDPVAFHDFERAGWQRAAEYYADAFGDVTSQMADPILDAVRIGSTTRVDALKAHRETPDGPPVLRPRQRSGPVVVSSGHAVRLLDVACGPGFIAAAAARRGAIATGLDFSAAMIAEARRRHPAIAFQEGDAEQLPFDDSSFDVVVMNFGMLHLARPEQAIAEARRVLKRGGRYAFSVWAAPEKAVGFGMALRAIEAFGKADVGLPAGPPFFQFSDADETKRTLADAGFVDVSIRTVPLTWRVSSPDAVFEALSRGGVRTAATLRAQTPEALEKIQAAVRLAVEQYAASDHRFVIPMPAVLAFATRP